MSMNVLDELEEMRQRMLREINAEFDRVIDNISKNSNDITVKKTSAVIQYPIMADPGIFKGKKPVTVIIDEKPCAVKTWKELVKTIMDSCIESKDSIIRMYELTDNVAGRTRVMLATSPEGMRSPLEITNRMYMETHYDTETLLKILIHRILIPIGYDVNRVSVIIR